MSRCYFCAKPLANSKQAAYRCGACSAVWCANGQCTGSYGKKQMSRSNDTLFQCCKQRAIKNI